MTEQAILSGKQSHADADRASRVRKAERIEAVLQVFGQDLGSKDVLDVGTGSGMIASYFQARVRTIWSVDVLDERADKDFPFRLIQSESLPFDDASFDVVISNHVIEHVDDQLRHLQEIARVLRPDGVCYLATPNKFWPIEPHFALPFLAWLPTVRLRDAYVRLARRGKRYDADLLSLKGLLRVTARAGLAYQDASLELAKTVLRSKMPWAAAAARLMWPAGRWTAPSLVAILKKDGLPLATEAGPRSMVESLS